MSSILPRKNLSKHQKLALLGFDIDLIPINDLEAYTDPKNQSYRKIYNRLVLCQWQGLNCGPMPILPKDDDYPVILKPIINLYGLSLDCYKIRYKNELYDKYWLNTGFWSTYFKGSSTSTDIILRKGEILWSNTFRGYLPKKSKPGVYNYWKLKTNYKLKPIIGQFIQKFLSDYSGIINVECIGDHIIEAHLRMGDVDQLIDTKVLQAIGDFYKSDFQEWNLEKDYQPEIIYLVPVFLKPGEKLLLTKTQVKICSIGCLLYQIDTGTTAHPPTAQRAVHLTCDNLEIGFKSRVKILKLNQKLTKNTKKKQKLKN